MRLKITIVLLITVLALFFNPLISIAEDFYVETDGSDENDGSESDPWGTIQGAIDNSTVDDGDTIHVGSGIFTENIAIDKSVNIYGNGMDDSIIAAGDSDDNVVSISSDDVAIKNLTVKGANSSEAAGVYVNKDIDDLSIRYCEIKNNVYGIILRRTEDVEIYNNDLENNDTGIYLYKADDSEITYNDFEDNTVGIYLVQSEIDSIYSNDFKDGDYGIFLLEDDDDYYSDDDVSDLEDDNNFDDMDEANVYLGEEDELDEEDSSCFIKTVCSVLAR